MTLFGAGGPRPSRSRSPGLALDPYAGKLREPIIRYTHLMRTLEPQIKLDQELVPKFSKLGMVPLNAPSVFNFYMP